MGGASLPVPQGLAVLAGMLALGQAALQGGGAGIAIRQAKAGGHQQLAGMHGGDSVDPAEVREAQPLGSERGVAR
jgi:hypothetical protein